MKKITTSLLIGFSTTLLSGLSPNKTFYGELPNVKVASEPILGIGSWGYILPWLRKVVYPSSTLQVSWRNFIVDIAFWSFIGYALLSIGLKLKLSMKT
jgi:hypothetical protein